VVWMQVGNRLREPIITHVKRDSVQLSGRDSAAVDLLGCADNVEHVAGSATSQN
jgi:hypothetical protein